MSGPDDKPDDPEDVTLWAGRLRPWPAPADPLPSDDLDDPDGDVAATVVARRGVARRGVARRGVARRGVARRDDDAGDGAEDEDTVIVLRERAGDGAGADTPVGDRERTIERAVAGADVGEDTAPADRAGRDDAVSAPGLSDEGTAPGRRAPIDETAPSPRKRSRSEGVGADSPTDLDTTVRSSRSRVRDEVPERIVDDTMTTARRVSGRAEPLPTTAPGRRRASGTGADLGVGAPVDPRETGADAAPRGPGAHPAPPSAGIGSPPREGARARTARVPGVEDSEVYGPRGDEAVRAHRAVPVTRIDPGHDAALVRPKAPRRGVAGPLVIGGTTVVFLAAALAALVLWVR